MTPEVKIGMITLDFHNRDNLYKRVDMRVDQMMEEGLLDEVSALYRSGILKKGTTAAQAIGYKEIISYLDGECSLSEAVELLKLSTRRYAKRQMKWFSSNNYVRWIDADRSGSVRQLSLACGV